MGDRGRWIGVDSVSGRVLVCGDYGNLDGTVEIYNEVPRSLLENAVRLIEK